MNETPVLHAPMTIAKCFKLLSLSALLITAIAAGTSPSAQAEPALTLKKGESVKISCESGISPILKDNTVQCGQVCKLSHWGYYSGSNCDQGGCMSQDYISGYTLKQIGSGSTIFTGQLDTIDTESAIRELQTRFSKSCDIITE